MNTEHTNQPVQAETATHSPIALPSIPERQRGFTAENIRDIAHECMRIGDNEQAEVVFAIANALRDGNLIIQSPAQQQAEPVAWVRFCSDGCYEGPLMNSSPAMDGARRTSGAWTPLFAAQPVARDVLMALKSLVAALNAAMPYMQTCEDGVGPDCTKQFQALIDGHAAIAAAEQAQQAAGASVNVENRTLELGPGLCVEGSPDGKMKVTCQFPHAPTWLPDAMTPDMMRAVQMRSELGAYAAANLAGAYDLFAEFWRVAVEEVKKGGAKC